MTADDPRHMRPRGVAPTASRRDGPGRGAVLLAALALAAVAASAAAGAALSEPAPTAVEQQLRAEIEGMVDAGVPRDDPKVALVEEQLADVEAGDGARGPTEPGVDVGALLAEARAEPAGGTPWQSGAVLCEPVPDLLSADDVADATCLSVPQPDGTGRYVAIAPDGVVRTVRFGNDGDVRRLPDRRVPGRPAPGAAMSPTPQGDLRVTPPGGATATVDLP